MGNLVTDFFGDALGWLTGSDFEEVRGLEFQKDSNVRHIPVVYGTRKIDDPIQVFAKGEGDENRWLYMVYVLCEGEIESIDEVFLDDKPVSDYGSYAVAVDGTEIQSYTGDTKVIVRKWTGSDTQVADNFMIAQVSEWTSSHRLRGRAYIAIRLRYDDELFTGIPKVTAIVRGKKVYDPRTTTTYFSNNPALCLYDYLTSTRYGKGLASTSVFVDDAADDLDAVQELYTQGNWGTPDSIVTSGQFDYLVWNTKPANAFVHVGSTLQNAASSPSKTATLVDGFNHILWRAVVNGKFYVAFEMNTGADFTTADTIYFDSSSFAPYQCDAIIDTSQKVFDNVKTILGGCRGLLPFSQGVYTLKIEQDAASEFSVDETHIVGGISIKAPRKKDKYNKVTATFTNPNSNWKEDIAVFPHPVDDQATYDALLLEDNSSPLEHEITLPTVNDYYLAREIARLTLYKSRNALQCSFIATSELLARKPGDIITITHPTPGWSSKAFIINSLDLGSTGEVKVSCVEHSAAIWTYDSVPLVLLKDDTTLPDPFSVTAPTVPVSTTTTTIGPDGTLTPAILFQFTESADVFAEKHEIQWKKSTDTKYQSKFTLTDEIILAPLEFAVTYDIRVRAWNSVNKKSDWLTDSHILFLDTTAPSAPTVPAATAGIEQVTLTWTNPTDNDFKSVDIYQNTTNSIPGTASYTDIAGDTFVVPDLTANTLYYFWLKAKDNVGNESAATASVNATTNTASASGGNWPDITGEGIPADWSSPGDNLVLDPSFDKADADGGYWSTPAQVSISSTGGEDGGPCIIATADSTFNQSSMRDRDSNDVYIPIRNGDRISGSFNLFVATAYDHSGENTIWMRPAYYDKDKVFDSYGGVIAGWDGTTKNAWQVRSTTDVNANGYITVSSSTARYAVLQLIMNNSSATTGDVKIDNVVLRRTDGGLSTKDNADFADDVTGTEKPSDYANRSGGGWLNGFESGTEFDGWTVGANQTLTAETTTVFAGSQCAAISTSTLDTDGTTTPPGGVYFTIPADLAVGLIGQTVRIGFMAYNATTGGTNVEVCYTAGATTSTDWLTYGLILDTWTPILVDIEIPSSVSDDTHYIAFQASTTSGEVLIDNVSIQGIGPIPKGGTTGQVLEKASGNDFDTQWATPSFDSYPGIFYEAGTTNITATTITLDFDTEAVDPDSNYTISAGEIVIANSGYYKCDVNISVNEDGLGGGVRGCITAWVEGRVSAGSWFAVAGSYSRVYVREDSGGTGLSMSCIVAASADDYEVRVRIVSDGTAVVDNSTEAGQSGIHLHRIRAY